MSVEKHRPSEIYIREHPDGGATVTAEFRHRTLYSQAFSDRDAARDKAKTLIDHVFEVEMDVDHDF